MYFNDSADGSVTNCTLRYNETDSGDGGGIQINNLGSNPTISGCTITSNEADDDGGGLAIKNYADPVNGGNNTITGNTAGDNGPNIYDPYGKW